VPSRATVLDANGYLAMPDVKLVMQPGTA